MDRIIKLFVSSVDQYGALYRIKDGIIQKLQSKPSTQSVATQVHVNVMIGDLLNFLDVPAHIIQIICYFLLDNPFKGKFQEKG